MQRSGALADADVLSSPKRALVDDDQARELGQDTYCLVDEHGNATYGGVTRWHLEEERRSWTLDGESSEVLGAGYSILVPSPDHQAIIRDALPELLT